MPPRIRPSKVHEVPQPSRPGAKGRPTPKRRDAQAARRTPLVPDTRATTKEKKAKARAVRDREYQAMLAGDERHLPIRDKGPERRWVRDYIDSRRNVGELLLPVFVLLMLAMFAITVMPIVYVIATVFLYLFTFWVVIDSWLLGRRIKRLVAEKFGASRVPDRIGFYGVLRTFQLRRTRLPRPQVKRGEFPG